VATTTYRVRNWVGFQHYKERCPPWVKLHKTLLDDSDYAALPDKAARYLPLVWLVASEYDGYLPDVATLAFRLRLSVAACSKVLAALGHYLEQVDDATLATRKHDASNVLGLARSQETEAETEGEGEGERLARAHDAPAREGPPHQAPHDPADTVPSETEWHEYGLAIGVLWTRQQADALHAERLGRGWCDFKGRPIRNWQAHLRAEKAHIEATLRKPARPRPELTAEERLAAKRKREGRA